MSSSSKGKRAEIQETAVADRQLLAAAAQALGPAFDFFMENNSGICQAIKRSSESSLSAWEEIADQAESLGLAKEVADRQDALGIRHGLDVYRRVLRLLEDVDDEINQNWSRLLLDIEEVCETHLLGMYRELAYGESLLVKFLRRVGLAMELVGARIEATATCACTDTEIDLDCVHLGHQHDQEVE